VTAPRRGELIVIAAVAIFLRLAIFLIVTNGMGVAPRAYASKGDGESYVEYARAVSGEKAFASLREYDRRVFPGFPALIALVHVATRLPIAAAGLLVTWVSAGIAAAGAAALSRDRGVGYAMVVLIPHYLINSSLIMSEAPLLALTVAALLLIREERQRAISSGLLFGAAGLVRPMACFAVAGTLLALLVRRQRARAGIVAATSLLVVIAGVVALHFWTGDALQGLRVYRDDPGAYVGRMFMWPFEALLTTPPSDAASIGRVVYIWLHVGVVMVACVVSIVALRRLKSFLDAVAVPWLIGNTLFALCVGSPWGFRHFPRFSIPAQAPMFWALRRWLPQRSVWWGLIAAVTFVIAVFGVRDSP
jgi:hypothetical protein